jgi:uncharacterized MAPEG superfamily protein
MVLSIELKMLLYSVCLGLIQLMVATHLSTKQRGMAWNVSPRDEKVPELTGLAGRMDRAFKNFKETFVFFVAVILIVQVTTLANHTSSLGAQIYFWARVIYIPLYAAGIPYVRSLVWLVSLIGLVMVVSVLF